MLLDGYFDIRFSPKLRLRSGKDKTPVGYELLIGDASLIFPERSVVSLLVPNRDVGFQAQGDLAGGKLALLGRHLQRQPGRWHQRDYRRRHEQRQGSRRTHRRAAVPIDDDAGPQAEQLRLSPGRVDRQSDRRAAVVQDVGRPDLLLVSRDDDRRRPAEPRDARGLSVSQGLRRLRRVRPHDTGDRDERRAAHGDQSGVGSDRLVCAHR